MRIVVDTNVFMSAIFFGGVPGRVLKAWNEDRVQLVISPDILDEYQRVGRELERKYGELGLPSILSHVTRRSMLVDAAPLDQEVSTDPDDDKFLACALAGRASVVVSGDRDLTALESWRGVRVLTPRQFLQELESGEE